MALQSTHSHSHRFSLLACQVKWGQKKTTAAAAAENSSSWKALGSLGEPKLERSSSSCPFGLIFC